VPLRKFLNYIGTPDPADVPVKVSKTVSHSDRLLNYNGKRQLACRSG
jgi:hypothetical protein